MLIPTPGRCAHSHRTRTHRTCDKRTESGDDATTKDETEAHRAWGERRVERHPGKDPAPKADAGAPTPPHSQLSPPEGRTQGKTHATLSSPRGTKAWDHRQPQAIGPTTARHTAPRPAAQTMCRGQPASWPPRLAKIPTGDGAEEEKNRAKASRGSGGRQTGGPRRR